MVTETLITETYKGYKIEFAKIGPRLFANVSKGKDSFEFPNNGYTTKADLLKVIKNEIDKSTSKPDISNPDGLSNYWIKGTDKVIRIRIDDTGTDSPREWDNTSLFSLHHSRYNLPEELNIKSSQFNGWSEMKSYIQKELKPLMIRQVSMYDHSGLSFNLGGPTDRWDSGVVGFIIITQKSWELTQGNQQFTQKLGEERIKRELETYDAWQSGDVYGFEIIDGKGKVEDSCWGFIKSGYKTNQEFEDMLIIESGHKKTDVELMK